jgi:hypothetical protein
VAECAAINNTRQYNLQKQSHIIESYNLRITLSPAWSQKCPLLIGQWPVRITLMYPTCSYAASRESFRCYACQAQRISKRFASYTMCCLTIFISISWPIRGHFQISYMKFVPICVVWFVIFMLQIVNIQLNLWTRLLLYDFVCSIYLYENWATHGSFVNNGFVKKFKDTKWVIRSRK